MKTYQPPTMEIDLWQLDVLTASDENMDASGKNDTDISWEGQW